MAEPLFPPELSSAEPPAAPRPPFVRPIEIAAIGSIVVVDQLTKFIVRSSLPLYAKKSLIPTTARCMKRGSKGRSALPESSSCNRP